MEYIRIDRCGHAYARAMSRGCVTRSQLVFAMNVEFPLPPPAIGPPRPAASMREECPANEAQNPTLPQTNMEAHIVPL